MKRIALAGLVSLVLLSSAAGADWPGFRNDGTGHSSERGLPTTWGDKENLVWHVKLPGPGVSSPIVWKDRVFVTSYSGYGNGTNEKAEIKNLKRHLLCLERQTGKVVWQKDIPARLPESEYEDRLPEHGYASSTPVTDGERVYFNLGQSGIRAFDFEGKQLWHVEAGPERHFWGSGSSPVLFGDLLLVNASIESLVLLALDKKTGKEVWRAGDIGSCWSSPVPVEIAEGKYEIVISTQGYLKGFDAKAGKKLWECETIGADHTGATPVTRKGIVYVMSAGFEGRWAMAVRAGGTGDVTKTHVVWQQKKAGASQTSPLLAGDHLYYFSTQVGCLRVDNGEIVFQERLPGLGREYASPVLVDGNIVFAARDGKMHVLAAGDKLKVIAQNKFEAASTFSASPAVSQGCYFFRSNDQLYCVGKQPAGQAPKPKITDKDYRIYRGNGQPATLDEMLAELRKTEVVFLGEDHDDPVAHHLEKLIFEKLSEGVADKKLALSLEMFERDVQHVLDEYCSDLITEQHLLGSGRPWNNYAGDYRDLVEHARKQKLRVLAANAPRRYVNMVSRLGAGELAKVPQGELRGLPPLPYAEASAAYAARFKKIMEEHSQPEKKPEEKKPEEKKPEEKKPEEKKPKPPERKFDIVKGLQAQSLWDASMAYSIAEHLKVAGGQVVNVNGRFHSEERLGIPEHLVRYRQGTTFLVVTMLPAKSFPKFDETKHRNLGDFVIVTDEALPRSYSTK